MIRILLSALLVLATQMARTQENAKPEKDSTHSVRKAVLLSAVVPGAGQVYNHFAMQPRKARVYWKLPLIYAGLGATGYMVWQNNSLQKELKTEYQNRQAGIAGLDQYKLYDDQGILTLRSTYLNRRDLFILGFTLVYVLQLVDAAVEAHFVHFDISEDLSMSITPQMISPQQAGMKLSFKFR